MSITLRETGEFGIRTYLERKGYTNIAECIDSYVDYTAMDGETLVFIKCQVRRGYFPKPLPVRREKFEQAVVGYFKTHSPEKGILTTIRYDTIVAAVLDEGIVIRHTTDALN